MEYQTHSTNSSEIQIRAIENGFIIIYTHLISRKEKYFETLEDLNLFLAEYYKAVR